MRASVAALHNADHPLVDYTINDPNGAIALVNAALASLDRDTMLSLAGDLDDFNNVGCNIDGSEVLP